MLNRIYQTEEKYIKCFCDFETKDGYTRYKDNRIKDMYSHNFTRIEHDVSKADFLRIVNGELDYRRAEGHAFLRIDSSAPFIHEVLKSVAIKAEVERYDYWSIESSCYKNMYENKAVDVRLADTDDVMKHGRMVDIVANYRAMTLEFAIRRIDRKFEIYSDPNNALNLYVSYDGIEAVGNCELMVNGDISKIEDFDIIDIYQKKGFGTQMIRNLLKISYDQGASDAYLVTDSDDTAKEMYKKCGFKRVGERTELMFKL